MLHATQLRKIKYYTKKMLQRSHQKTAAGWRPSRALLSHFFAVASLGASIFCLTSLFVFFIS